MRSEANWVYDLRVEPHDEEKPMDIRENVVVNGAIDDEYDRQQMDSHVHVPSPHHSPYILVSPAHATPYYSDYFAGTSFGQQSCEEYGYAGLWTSLDDILC